MAINPDTSSYFGDDMIVPLVDHTASPSTRSPVTVKTKLHFRFKRQEDATRWHNTSWETTEHQLHATMQDFTSALHYDILDIRHKKYQGYEAFLRANKRMIHTSAHFEFDDARDQLKYLAMDYGRWRLQTVQDLLMSPDAHGEGLVIEIVVWVDDLPCTTSSPHPPRMQDAPLKYHLIGTGRVQAHRKSTGRDPDQQYPPMIVVVLQPYGQNSNDDCPSNILVLSRIVNGVPLGCAEDKGADEEPGDAIWNWIPMYQGLEEEDRYDKMEKILDAKMESGEAEEPGIPRLPPVTFLPYTPKAGVEMMLPGELSLALRVVNRLQALHAEQIKLPYDWTEVVPSHMTGSNLRKQLKLFVHKECPGQDRSRLFGAGRTERWNCHLWVMPQSNQVEKLHWVSDQDFMYRYLDPVMVNSGERKLYLEVHLVPRAS